MHATGSDWPDHVYVPIAGFEPLNTSGVPCCLFCSTLISVHVRNSDTREEEGLGRGDTQSSVSFAVGYQGATIEDTPHDTGYNPGDTTGSTTQDMVSTVAALYTQPKVTHVQVVSQQKGLINPTFFVDCNSLAPAEYLEPGDTLTFTVNASDPSGSPLEFKWPVSSQLSEVSAAAAEHSRAAQFT